MDKIVKIHSLKKIFNTGTENVVALENINLELEKGTIASITGESGSGKSTLLNLIGGLDRPTEGSLIVENANVEKMNETKLSIFRRKTIGFIFQFHYLLPDFTAIENVMLPYLANDYSLKYARNKAHKLLSEVGLAKRIKHKPNQLSGGEQQRVAVARSLINDPILLLADEPTGNLDRENTHEVINLLFKLVREHELTLILVTHNLEIWRKADRCFYLTYGNLTEATHEENRDEEAFADEKN